MNKKTTYLVITLLLTSFAVNLRSVHAGTDHKDAVAEALLKILGNTHDRIQELLNTLPDDEVPEDAQEAFDEAVSLRESAQTYYNSGEYLDSIETSRESLKKYGKVFSILGEAGDDDEADDEETETDLKCSIEIASNYLARIKGTVDALSEIYGENPEHAEVLERVNEVLVYLENAEDFLVQASEAYDSGDYNKAARSLAAARRILGRANGILTSVYKAHKVARTEKFMEKVNHRIEGLENKVERLRGHIGNLKTNNAMASMNRAKGRLAKLRAGLSESNVDEVIDGIVVETAGVNAAIDELDEDIGKKLYNINKQESKFDRYEKKIQRLADHGVDTTELSDMLQDAKELLDTAFLDLQSGNPEAAEEKIEEADKVLNELDDLIDELEEQAEEAEEADEDEKKLDEKKAEIEEKLQRLRDRISEADDVDTEDLESELDQLHERLNQATGEDELDDIEEALDDLEEQLEDLVEGNEIDEEEPEETPEEEEPP